MLKINESIIDALDLMPNDIRAVFYPAIFDYLRKDKEPDFTETNLAFWILIKSLLKKKSPKTDTANYDAIIADSATMTQAQLAAKYGKSQSTINRILKNKKSTPVEPPYVSLSFSSSPTLSVSDDIAPWEIPADVKKVLDEENYKTYLAMQEENAEPEPILTDEELMEFWNSFEAEPQTENPQTENKTVELNPTETKQTEPLKAEPITEPVKEPVKLSETETAAEALFVSVYYNAWQDARNNHPNLKAFDWSAKANALTWFLTQIKDIGYENLERLIKQAACDAPTLKLGFTFADLKNYIYRHKKEVLEYEIY